MLSEEENERLTRVGPGTTMGRLLRNYWQPIAPASRLAKERVLPIRLYGESLVLFQDDTGRRGLVADRCAHRSVKLDCAYTTEAGIRCPYHGWTYDTQGQCVDQPGEPAGSSFKEKVRLTAYPVEELAGLIFAYLGPESPPPLLPRWDRLVWDDCYRVVAYAIVPCNWLQCMENTVDLLHPQYLHGQYFQHLLEKQGLPKDHPDWRLARGFSTPFLKHDCKLGKYGIDRRWFVEGQSLEDDTWSNFSPLVFPNTHVTSGSGRHDFGWRVPMDDTHTMQVVLRTFEPGNGIEVPHQGHVPYYEMPVRDEEGNFLSLNSVNGQDFMVWTLQDEIVDRSKERLGDSDRGLILYRQLIGAQLKRVAEGQVPINVFRDPAQNERIDLPAPWDRGYAWGYAKDGSYIRGSVTAADMLPPEIAGEIEDLFVAAAERKTVLAASST